MFRLLNAGKQELPEAKIIVTGSELTCEAGERYWAYYGLSHPISLAGLITALKHCLNHSFADELIRSADTASRPVVK